MALPANVGTRARLTELQTLLLNVANKRGKVTVRISDRRRRSAAARLAKLGLIAWDARLYGWVLTDEGRAKVSRVGGRIHDVTPGLAYSDYLREN